MTPTEVDRTTAVHEMHMKFDEDRTFSSGDMLADRQTDKRTRSSQYATALSEAE